nr:hypothetical protein [Paenactinomyces guangxiensis]
MGIQRLAVVSNGQEFKNINKSSAVKRTEKRLKRAGWALSRKYGSRKKRGEKPAAKGGSNIRKNVLRVQKYHQRLSRMWEEYRTWVVSVIVKTKPGIYHHRKAACARDEKEPVLGEVCFGSEIFGFKVKLLNTCRKMGMELEK